MQQGFFSKKEVQSSKMLNGKMLSCDNCGLHLTSGSKKSKIVGKGKKAILNVFEFPNKNEKSFKGRDARMVKRMYEKLGIDFLEDCFNIYAVSCMPAKDVPSVNEIACCRRNLLDAVQETQPKIIMLFGDIALKGLIEHRYSKSINNIHQWRGFTIPDQDLKAWVCPVYAPSFVDNNNDRRKETIVIWRQDFKRSLKKLNTAVYRDKKPKIIVLDDIADLPNKLGNLLAFDYETTGLKPHLNQHKIISCAVADNPDSCYAFLMPQTKKGTKPWVEILANREKSKMAHNMKFEESWSVNILNQSVTGWEWDSMLAAHLIDNRPGITGLKFQTYVNFGIVDYSSEIDSYLKGIGDSGNSLNQIENLLKSRAGVNMLLTYNAMDTIYQYRLALEQIKQLNYDFLPF